MIHDVVYSLPEPQKCAISSVRIHSGAAQDLFTSNEWQLQLASPFCRRSADGLTVVTVHAHGVLYQKKCAHQSGFETDICIYFVPSNHAPTESGRFEAIQVDGLGRKFTSKGNYTQRFTEIIDNIVH